MRRKRLDKADVPYIEKPIVQTGLAPWLFAAELERLRYSANDVTGDFVEVAYGTAAKRGSVEGLMLFQVDPEAGRPGRGHGEAPRHRANLRKAHADRARSGGRGDGRRERASAEQ